MCTRLAITAVAIVASVCQSSLSRADNLTYDFLSYPDIYNGCTLTGHITTDGITGVISDSDLIGWQITVTPPVDSGLPSWTGDETTTATDAPWTLITATTQNLSIDVGQYLCFVDLTGEGGASNGTVFG